MWDSIQKVFAPCSCNLGFFVKTKTWYWNLNKKTKQQFNRTFSDFKRTSDMPRHIFRGFCLPVCVRSSLFKFWTWSIVHYLWRILYVENPKLPVNSTAWHKPIVKSNGTICNDSFLKGQKSKLKLTTKTEWQAAFPFQTIEDSQTSRKNPYFVINLRQTAHTFCWYLKAAWHSCSVKATLSPPEKADHKADIIAATTSSKTFLLLWHCLSCQIFAKSTIICKKRIVLESINYFLYICK